jgi:drug/metabolite transporter (DMT)-like permease
MDIVYAWVASIVSGFSPLIVKASSKSLVKSPWLFNILWVGFGIPPVVVLAVIKGGGMPGHWVPILMMSACSALFYMFYTLSLYRIDITTMSPLFSLRTAFAAILGILLLGEYASPLNVTLIVVVVLASPLAAHSKERSLKAFFSKYVMLAIIAMASLALMGYFTNISVAENGYASTLLWQDILTLIMLLPTLCFTSRAERKVTKSKLYPFMLLGLTGFTYTATATLAYAHNLALSSVIISLPTSMVFAYVLSRRYDLFSENHSSKVYALRFSGASVMVACAIWLSLL